MFCTGLRESKVLIWTPSQQLVIPVPYDAQFCAEAVLRLKAFLNKGGEVKIKSNSQYLVWSPAVLSTAVHLLLMDCSFCEMLPHSSTKAPASSRTFLWGMALALALLSNRSQTCSMRLRSGLFAGHGRTLTFLSYRKSCTEREVWLVALSCQDELAGRVPHVEGGCLRCNAQR